uniref:SHSP domain-containing protein n=1 Tax=Panagrellus redivivus TaxID=6233 RepID=A0A7E4VHD9_PANRE
MEVSPWQTSFDLPGGVRARVEGDAQGGYAISVDVIAESDRKAGGKMEKDRRRREGKRTARVLSTDGWTSPEGCASCARVIATRQIWVESVRTFESGST